MKFLSWGVRCLFTAAAAACLMSCGGGAGQEPVNIAQVVPKALSAPFPLAMNGFYWNPAEPGTGLFIETQGSTIVVTLYRYDESGKAVWYMATGELTGLAEGISGEQKRCQSSGSDQPDERHNHSLRSARPRVVAVHE